MGKRETGSGSKGVGEGERQTDRQTDRDRERTVDTQRRGVVCVCRRVACMFIVLATC